ncbi:MAG TPA: hypothetical protein VE863_16740 [Pyrinomonadaceae bacterium]|jgi:hypothetical protein|nr:hypothetical protein [Pyrinomonadaceae bacterium]
MSISRRKFVKAGVLAATFAALPARGVMGQSFKERDGDPGETPTVQSTPLPNYSKATFVSYLNSIFQLHTVAGIVEVTLVSVDDMPAPKGGECFTLLFRGGSQAQKQDTYTLVHPSLGTFQLMLVPAGSDQNGAQAYVATLNRLSQADFANITAPTRTNGSRSGTSTSSGTTTGTTTSSIPTPPTTAPTVTAPAIAPASKAPARKKRKRPRQASQKQVDDLDRFMK